MSELDAILADIRSEDDPNRKNLRVAEVVSRSPALLAEVDGKEGAES